MFIGLTIVFNFRKMKNLFHHIDMEESYGSGKFAGSNPMKLLRKAEAMKTLKSGNLSNHISVCNGNFQEEKHIGIRKEEFVIDQGFKVLNWSYGVMVSTLDFESNNPSSILGRTFFFSLKT